MGRPSHEVLRKNVSSPKEAINNFFFKRLTIDVEEELHQFLELDKPEVGEVEHLLARLTPDDEPHHAQLVIMAIVD